MPDQATQNAETTDQAAESKGLKTSQRSAESGVISGQPNQELHGQAFAVTHANDLRPSDPSLIATKDGESLEEYKARVAAIKDNPFQLVDSQAEKEKVFEHPAKQAVEPLPPLSPTLNEAPYNSSVKLNVGITNVPEVSEGIKPEELLRYTDKTLEAGAQTIEHMGQHLAQPNAVNNDLSALAAHFSQSPYQLNEDIQAIIASIDQPMNADERAEAAGNLLPLFFFEGAKEPINPETVEQMSLKGMTEEELAQLGIEKRITQLDDVESVEVANQEALEVGIEPKPGSLSNVQARDWYNAQVAQIDAVEQEMRLAGKTSEEVFDVTTNLRNAAKSKCRTLMEDRELAESLDRDNPIKSKEEILEKYGGDYEQAIAASKRTNRRVNATVEELRKREQKNNEENI